MDGRDDLLLPVAAQLEEAQPWGSPADRARLILHS
jgi:hypothetical protein